ncbi:collagen-like triple helix repeat-containing protein [Methylobacterium pseudosasicola]|uniref:Uncharacterized protein n=1 Tax=Methylobacterium pseudosasicola TaxID=582667 RepID=A0A1I4U126_9HYPH|nr:collagen-like protein [Methylobacterium pseudosasicola]SFM82748.1 hypothetical protein SAMN05192568_106134 [Methylobacterium pseudosasicola]
MIVSDIVVLRPAAQNVPPGVALPAGPPGLPGANGLPGAQGEPGAPGKDGITPDISGKLDKTGDASGTSLQQPGATRALTPIQILTPYRNLAEFRFASDADDTASFNRAIGDLQAGARVVFDSVKTISGPINMSRDNYTIEAVNPRAGLIQSSALNQPIFNITANRCRLRDIATIYTGGSPTSGATAFQIAGTYSDLSHCTAFNGYRLFAWRSGGHLASNLLGYDWAWSALDFQNANDVYVSNFLFSTSTQTNGAGGAVRLYNQCESVRLAGGEVIGGKFGLLTGADTYARGSCPAFGEITDVKFDNQGQGSILDKSIDMVFQAPWFSGGRSGSGYSGLTIRNSRAPRFHAPRFFACGYSGLVVEATTLDLELRGALAHANSITGGAGNGRGIEVMANATDFKIIGGVGGNDLFRDVPGYGTGQQGFNLVLNSGCDRFSVIGFGGPAGTAGHIFDGSASGANKTLLANYSR